jgi:hypothetical protein
MRTCVVVLLSFTSMLVGATSAHAQHLSLVIRDGQVTLDARDATLQQILEEWARVGGIQVINAEKLTGTPPLTLLLRELSERQALDVLLRGRNGYVLTARTEGAPGASSYGQIIVLPSSPPPLARPAVASNTEYAREPAVPATPPFPDASRRDDDSNAASAHVIDRAATPFATDRQETPQAGSGSAAQDDGANRPPTPMLPPPAPVSDPHKPATGVVGSNRPGVVTAPAGPPAGVLYPPVTNPNHDPSRALPTPQP